VIEQTPSVCGRTSTGIAAPLSHDEGVLERFVVPS
jgi:hypothetical protein